MKVLYVCTVPTEQSGIPIVIFNILKALDKANMKIGYTSINNPNENYINQLKEWGIDLHVIPRKMFSPITYVYSLYRIAKNYDIIHVHGNSATMFLELFAAKIAGVKIRIAHSHNTTCKHKLIDKIFRPLFYFLVNGRMACGEEAGKWLFKNKPFKIINNGIDVNKFSFSLDLRKKIRTKYNLKERITIGHIGNFNEQKNHSFLIDIFYEFHRINPASVLILIGDGPLKEKIERKVKSLGLIKDVIFLGSLNNPEYYLSALDLIVMPSFYEGLPLTMIEEQANGLQVLASDSITPDANITGQVTFKSLQDSAVSWATKINDMTPLIQRDDSKSEISETLIQEAGYDIISIASDLKSYYSHYQIKDNSSYEHPMVNRKNRTSQ